MGGITVSIVREHVKVRYRLSKPRIFQNPYDLNPARIRVMHMNKLADFQLRLRMGGHTILGVSRISREEYLEYKHKIKARKAQREKEKQLQLQEA